MGFIQTNNKAKITPLSCITLEQSQSLSRTCILTRDMVTCEQKLMFL